VLFPDVFAVKYPDDGSPDAYSYETALDAQHPVSHGTPVAHTWSQLPPSPEASQLGTHSG
jgi:hypothetical protein